MFLWFAISSTFSSHVIVLLTLQLPPLYNKYAEVSRLGCGIPHSSLRPDQSLVSKAVISSEFPRCLPVHPCWISLFHWPASTQWWPLLHLQVLPGRQHQVSLHAVWGNALYVSHHNERGMLSFLPLKAASFEGNGWHSATKGNNVKLLLKHNCSVVVM